jgi:predicted nucleic acid-binding protein
MILADVNVLVYAHRADAPGHAAYRAWLAFAHLVRRQPNAVPIAPGARHWDIDASLCQTAGVKGNLIPDAYLAALAIESGSEWITTDRDYSRFPGLKWRHPLAT